MKRNEGNKDEAGKRKIKINGLNIYICFEEDSYYADGSSKGQNAIAEGAHVGECVLLGFVWIVYCAWDLWPEEQRDYDARDGWGSSGFGLPCAYLLAGVGCKYRSVWCKDHGGNNRGGCGQF